MWLATKHLKTIHAASYRNHIEKLTALGAQIMKFRPKINILSSYFIIFMPNYPKKTFKLKFDDWVTAVNFLIDFLDWKTSLWYEFYPFYLSVSSVLWHKFQMVSHSAALHRLMQVMLGYLIVFSDCFILITMDRGHCQAVLKQGSQPMPLGNWKLENVYYKTKLTIYLLIF